MGKMSRKVFPSKEAITDAIEKSHGVTSVFCARLDVSRRQWDRFIRRHPEFREVVDAAREGMIDQAEKTIAEMLESENEAIREKAAEFILRRIGSKRGWGDGPQTAV